MRKLNITPEEMTAVCGRMPACRAADSLGLNLPQFYMLARRYSLTTAHTYQHWSPQDDERLMSLVSYGRLQKEIAEDMGRSLLSVRSRVTRLKKLKHSREVTSS
ncbi:sigma-70 family RNA polymerase sigma factor [Enterobacter sp. Z1]|nr:sigma-70 family RNA polymerase sigma factor [Enterobacter sp. Z1]